MFSRSLLLHLTIAFFLMGIFVSETDARRKILRGRKTITRRYYRSSALPAWSISVIAGLLMLLAGGGLYLVLKKFIVESVEASEVPSYQPARQDDV